MTFRTSARSLKVPLGAFYANPGAPIHRELAKAVADRGCLATEFPPGTPPRKYHFPQRNRIIAGLARAVLFIEAPEKSGALITPHYALEEGREVFAVPGPIHKKTGRLREPWGIAVQLSPRPRPSRAGTMVRRWTRT